MLDTYGIETDSHLNASPHSQIQVHTSHQHLSHLRHSTEVLPLLKEICE